MVWDAPFEVCSGSYTEPWMQVRFKSWLASNGAVSENQIVAFAEKACGATGLDIAKLPKRWAAGKIAKTSTIKRIDAAFPGSGQVYFLPLWKLLSGKSLSELAIKKLMIDYASPNPEMWLFPKFNMPNEKGVIFKDASADLADRGDIFGLMGILALMKAAERRRDAPSYCYHFTNLVRCLPWSAKEPWLAPQFGSLCRVVNAMWLSQLPIVERFRINWKLVHKQFLKRHEYRPRVYRKLGKDGRYIEYPDPIIYTNCPSQWQRVDFD